LSLWTKKGRVQDENRIFQIWQKDCGNKIDMGRTKITLYSSSTINKQHPTSLVNHGKSQFSCEMFLLNALYFCMTGKWQGYMCVCAGSSRNDVFSAADYYIFLSRDKSKLWFCCYIKNERLRVLQSSIQTAEYIRPKNSCRYNVRVRVLISFNHRF